MARETVEIGTLRWPVQVVQRNQAPTGTSSIVETLGTATSMMADIQPIGALTYLQGQQTDRPITHYIRMRFLDWIDETYVITRTSLDRDGRMRNETFRIRRIKELGGRKRFIEIEAELETRST